MEKQLFRKKSMDKISSPDLLTDYIRVTRPGIWMILAAAFLLLSGFVVWGVCGTLESRLSVSAVSDGRHLICYIPENSMDKVKRGMCLRFQNEEWTITSIADSPTKITEEKFDEYVLHTGNLKPGEWVYVAETDGKAKAGVYAANIIIESISPISFIVN